MQSRCLPKKNAALINKENGKTDPRTLNAPRMPNGRYQKMQPPALANKQNIATGKVRRRPQRGGRDIDKRTRRDLDKSDNE